MVNIGKVISLNEKGFGFLEVEGREKNLFFHAKALLNGVRFDELVRGDILSFESIESTDKGECALGVERV